MKDSTVEPDSRRQRLRNYVKGKLGVEKLYKFSTSEKRIRDAAEDGDIDAMYEMRRICRKKTLELREELNEQINGFSFAPDMLCESGKWLRKAAEQGHSGAKREQRFSELGIRTNFDPVRAQFKRIWRIKQIKDPRQFVFHIGKYYYERRWKRNPISYKLSKLKEKDPEAIQSLIGVIEQRGEIDLSGPIAVVPSHDPKDPDSGIRQVAQGLAQKKAGQDITHCLYRSNFVRSQSRNNSRRSWKKHLESLATRQHGLFEGEKVLLLDDVTTTGRSMIAARNKLYLAGAVEVLCLAIARTVNKDFLLAKDLGHAE